MIYIFTRREVLAATKTTSNKLQYLERKALINPCRVERTGKPTVLYSLEQMIAIALNKQLKNIDSNCAASLIYFLANFDRPQGFDYAGKSLYCVGSEASFDVTALVKDIEVLTQYKLVVIPDLGEILAEIIVNAKSSEIIDFESFRDRLLTTKL